jgi:thiol-disulfide isomerase/thioredoxin
MARDRPIENSLDRPDRRANVFPTARKISKQLNPLLHLGLYKDCVPPGMSCAGTTTFSLFRGVTMKIQYLALLTAAMLMTTGVLTSCSTTQTTDTAAKTEACAAKNKPCAAKADPCAAKKADPCAAKKADPCAAKTAASSGASGKLAASLQGKPVIVDIFADWCPACKNIAPALAELKKTYGDKATFVVLDVSDAAKVKASEAKAKELGLSAFFTANKAQTGRVSIIDPATGKSLSDYNNEPNAAAYSSVLDKAIAKKG